MKYIYKIFLNKRLCATSQIKTRYQSFDRCKAPGSITVSLSLKAYSYIAIEEGGQSAVHL